MPASAISAAHRAHITPPPLRLMQGTSTSPATGSHTSPSWFLMAIAAALAAISGVPPFSSTKAAAAMAAALPHSAWQPPSAPAMLACWARTRPMPPAAASASQACWRLAPRCSIMASTAPGRMPQLPAVGLATMRPMAALYSATEMAMAMAQAASGPESVCPAWAYWLMRQPSPPVSPLWERTSFRPPRRAACSITVRSSSSTARSCSLVRPSCSACSSSTSWPMVTVSLAARRANSSMESYAILMVFPP